MILFRSTSLLLFSLILAGCFGGGSPVPQDTYYRLPTPVVEKKITGMPKLSTIAVSPLDSDALYRERAILYSKSDDALSLKRYHYHHWTAIPNSLIQQHLIDFLRSSSPQMKVIRYGQQNNIDAHLTGHIRRFERLAGQGKVIVELELQIEYTRNNRRQVFYNIYTSEQSASSSDMQATVAAFGVALQEVYQRFLQDIRSSKII